MPNIKKPIPPKPKENTDNKFGTVYTFDGKGALRSVYVELTKFGLNNAIEEFFKGLGKGILIPLELFNKLFGYTAGNGFDKIETFVCPDPKGTRSTYDPNPLANGQSREKQENKLRPAPAVTDKNNWFLQSMAYITYDQLQQSRKLFFGILSLTASTLSLFPAVSLPFTILSYAISIYGDTVVFNDKIDYAYYYVYIDGFNSTMILTIYFDKNKNMVGRTDPQVLTN